MSRWVLSMSLVKQPVGRDCLGTNCYRGTIRMMRHVHLAHPQRWCGWLSRARSSEHEHIPESLRHLDRSGLRSEDRDVRV